MYEKIKYFYDKGYWKAEQVNDAVEKSVITQQQAEDIMKGEADAEV